MPVIRSGVTVDRATGDDYPSIVRVGTNAGTGPFVVRSLVHAMHVPGTACHVARVPITTWRPGSLWVAGFALSVASGDERIAVVKLAVSHAHRGKGLGRALLDGLASHARRECRTLLSTTIDETDDAAIGFLVACGFRGVGLVRDKFGVRDGYHFERAVGRCRDGQCERR